MFADGARPVTQTPSRPVVDPPRHAWFKAALFGLLALNAAIYSASGTLAEALDSTAWLALLVLYELETDFGLGPGAGWAAGIVRSVRLVAAAAVVTAAAGYVREREWLDAVNAGLWIAIVVLFEWQIRFPTVAVRRQRMFTAGAWILYAGLGTLVAIWIWQGEWFDAYDALLWLAALIVVEMNILRKLGGTRV